MLSTITSRLKTEYSHFQALSSDAQHMLLSYALYLAAYPLIGIFLNAYLWRSSGSLWQIVIYNLGYVIGLPTGFYFNGLLLKKIHILRLYFFGAILQAIIPILVIFLPFSGIVGILIYGFLYGNGAGFFWGNKNYLDLQITRGTNRMYYNSLGQIFDLLMNIIVPFCAGWFIVLITSKNPDSSFIAYKIVMIIGFILLLLSGFSVQFSKITQISIHGMLLKNPNPIWKHMRTFNILFNLQVGTTMVIPNILILILVGGEGILGTIQTVTAGISAIALYVIGRKSTISNASHIVLFGSIMFLAGTSLLAGTFSWIGALAYSMVITIAWASQWTPYNSVNMDLMDSLEPDSEKQYAYVCDNELYFNIGRAFGIGLICIIAIFLNEHSALQWTPLIVGILQLPLSWLIAQMVKEIQVKKVAVN